MTKLRSTSVVDVAGTLPNGETVVQEVKMEHDVGAPAGGLISQAFVLIRQYGGLSVDSVDHEAMDFYPLSKFEKVTFSVRRVALARPVAMQ